MIKFLRSLGSANYRIWVLGALVSNIGTWFQRVAQDWLVLTELTHRSATAVGILMALQTIPVLLLLPITGYVADRFDRRWLLVATQGGQGALALLLGLLTVSGEARLWHVYFLAFLLGCISSFDAPARHTFVSELVGEKDLANAVSLNSTSFNLARMIGPSLAGTVIALAGSGIAFLVNAVSFGAVLVSLLTLRVAELHRSQRLSHTPGGFIAGFSYVWSRRDLLSVMIMLLLVGTFGLNFPIFLSTMSASVFNVGPSHFGLFTSVMAIGSIIGAVLIGRLAEPKMKHLLAGTIIFGAAFASAAFSPRAWLFAIALVPLGMASVAFTTATTSYLQLATEPSMRGRVMAIRLAVGTGGTPIGAPVFGWLADTFGPRWGGLVGAASGFSAALIAWRYLRSQNEHEP